MERIVKKL